MSSHAKIMLSVLLLFSCAQQVTAGDSRSKTESRFGFKSGFVVGAVGLATAIYIALKSGGVVLPENSTSKLYKFFIPAGTANLLGANYLMTKGIVTSQVQLLYKIFGRVYKVLFTVDPQTGMISLCSSVVQVKKGVVS